MGSPLDPSAPLEADGTFDRVAADYDSAPLRFFVFAAERAVDLLKLRPGERVLDVAAGTGAVSVVAAQRIAPTGRVDAVDLSRPMLAQLEQKAQKLGLSNIDINVMDATALDFGHGRFDCVICSFGLFFLSDMEAALREWVRVTRPGGRVMFTALGQSAFGSMRTKLVAALARRNVHLPLYADGTSHRLGKKERCRDVAAAAGLQEIDVVTHQVGYHLRNAEDWWTLVMNTAPRGYIDRLPEVERDRLRREHLDDVRSLETDQGLWLDVPVHFTQGRVPG